MKQSETDYLDQLFSFSADATDEVEVQFPLVEVPQGLGIKLHAISELAVDKTPVQKLYFQRWHKATAIAACFLVAIVGVQFYQQQQTLTQLKSAQTDLATALHYLGEANRITQEQLLSSLNENMNREGLEPAMGEGRGSISPAPKHRKLDIEQKNRQL